MLDYPIRHVLVRHEQGATHMADGYARAIGQGRRRHRDVGPGRDQPGHRHRHRDAGLVADRLHHRPGRQSQLIGSDAFQETDITGVTLPITKHNYLVTRAEDIAPTLREAFCVARVGPSGPGARRHHQGRAAGDAASSTGTRAAPHLRGYRPDDALPGDGDIARRARR